VNWTVGLTFGRSDVLFSAGKHWLPFGWHANRLRSLEASPLVTVLDAVSRMNAMVVGSVQVTYTRTIRHAEPKQVRFTYVLRTSL
jgi:hypothetical protein